MDNEQDVTPHDNEESPIRLDDSPSSGVTNRKKGDPVEQDSSDDEPDSPKKTKKSKLI